MRCVAALCALLFIGLTAADPDLWGHVRFGEDILDHRAITSHDPYSFTSDRPWVNHEWLAETLVALAYRAAGAAGIVALKTIVIAGALALVSKALRRVAWRPVDHDALLGLAIFGTFLRYHLMRPQVFSVLLCAGLLSILVEADRGRRRTLVAAVPVMLLWANLHGGWIVGLGILLIWCAVRLTWSNPGAIDRRRIAAVAVAATAATLVNPYGVGLWTFLRDTVGLSRPDIVDWLPLFRLPVLFIVPAATAAIVGCAALVKARRGVDPAHVLIVAALAVGTVRINRIDVFFVLAVIMLLGPHLGRARAAGLRTERPTGPPLWRKPLAMAIVLLAAGGLWTVGGTSLACVSENDTPEPQAVAFLRERAPRAKVLTFFDWGEYAIWQLGPDLKVSMDGRRETVYSDGLFQAHLRLYHDRPGATKLVTRLRPDLIWLPAELAVVRRLERAGWRVAFRGPSSVILAPAARAGGPAMVVRGPIAKGRCFPDP